MDSCEFTNVRKIDLFLEMPSQHAKVVSTSRFHFRLLNRLTPSTTKSSPQLGRHAQTSASPSPQPSVASTSLPQPSEQESRVGISKHSDVTVESRETDEGKPPEEVGRPMDSATSLDQRDLTEKREQSTCAFPRATLSNPDTRTSVDVILSSPRPTSGSPSVSSSPASALSTVADQELSAEKPISSNPESLLTTCKQLDQSHEESFPRETSPGEEKTIPSSEKNPPSSPLPSDDVKMSVDEDKVDEDIQSEATVVSSEPVAISTGASHTAGVQSKVPQPPPLPPAIGMASHISFLQTAHVILGR